MAGTWTALATQPNFNADVMLLLTDGTVMCHELDSNNWHKLTPDASGSTPPEQAYINGSWSTAASFPDNPAVSPAQNTPTGVVGQNGPTYAPRFFASAVLADGTVFVAGGEYNNVNLAGGNQNAVDVNIVALYDPVADGWTYQPAPTGWSTIGDSPSCVLPDGTLLLGQGGNATTTATAIFDPPTQVWKPAASKLDPVAEEGFTLLPDNTVLAVQCTSIPNAEKYIIATDKWVKASQTKTTLPQSCPKIVAEVGPAVLLPNGHVFAIGATGSTGLYTPPTKPTDQGTWAQGPTLQVNIGGTPQTMFPMDAPAVLLPNGKVLCAGSPGPVCSIILPGYNGPTNFFEFDPTNNTATAITSNVVGGTMTPPNANNVVWLGRFLLLPTGQVLFANGQPDIEVYTPDGAPQAAWKPTITSAPGTLIAGETFTISGTQFNGLSQACMYGDDQQMATNYPIVLITSVAAGDRRYLRTFNHSTMAVATGATPVSTHVTVPADTPVGDYQLVVIANGIASDPVNVSVVVSFVVPPTPGWAIARTPEHLDVFWVGLDGSVGTTWWDANANNGAWNTPFQIAGAGSAQGAVAAVARTPEHLDVFWVGLDGSVGTTWWDANANNGAWNAPFQIAPAGSAQPGSVAAVARTPDHLDVFWVGLDGSVGTTWWDANANNGAWNTPFEIAPAGSAQGTVTAVARTPDHLDVFWVGLDGSVGTTWWDANANNGAWNTPFQIAPAGSAQGTVTAVARTPDHLDVFWVGLDGSVGTTWWDANANNGAWNAPFQIAPAGSAQGTVTAVARTPDHLDVFWVGLDGSVGTNWWEAGVNNGAWNAPFQIAGAGSAQGAVAAVARTPDHLDVFWVGLGGSVGTNFWDANFNYGNWNTSFQIAPANSAQNWPNVTGLSASASSGAAVARTPEHLDVFWVGLDGSVGTTWWDAGVNNGAWNAPFEIAPAGSAQGAVTAVGRTPEHLDVFWVGLDGSVGTTWWDANANNGAWNTPFQIAGAGSAQGAVTAVARTPEHLDVFWVGLDGSVGTTWWDANANNGAWNAPFQIAPAGSAQPGSVAAVARTPEHLDVFWVGLDGSVGTTWWDANANNGAWNTPFEIAPAGSAQGTVAAVARTPEHLDVFWVGLDGSVGATWWDANANNGAWNTPFQISPAGSAQGTVTAVARTPEHLDVFWVGLDGSVGTTWWDANANNGAWNTPFEISPAGSAQGTVTAVGRTPEHLDVFWVGLDGSVGTTWWDANANNGAWNTPFQIANANSAQNWPNVTGLSAPASSGAAVTRTPDHLDVFWVAQDGGIGTTWWDANANNGAWNTPFEIAPSHTPTPRGVSVCARQPNHLDVFWVNADGSVATAWWDAGVNQGKWNTPFLVAPANAAQPGSVAAVARTPDHLDVFWVAQDGGIGTTWWDANANNGAWNTPFEIAPSHTPTPGGVSVCARQPNHLDVFWVNADGSVATAWWDAGVSQGKWNTPFLVAPANSAQPGSVAAVARTPDHLDVFWVAQDGGIGTTWWDAGINHGNWNTPFEIAPSHTPTPGGVSVCARQPNHLDVFWVNADGSVATAWWDAGVSQGKWNTPFLVAPANSAQPGSVAAVARTPDHLDVFWVAQDGGIGTTWWDANANNGAWNTPF